METVVSGARPTGFLHLGNYFGAIKNWILMQEQFNCFYFIADYHSLTTHPKANELNSNVKELLATYIACGVDPEKSTLYVQSHIPEIPELYLMFNMLAYKGELEKCPTFKDKVRSQSKAGKSINAGLLTYPVLMAVDILIHRAKKVPVGKDQEPHMEMARNFAKRFNFNTESTFFPEPEGFNFGNELLKIPSLDGEGKMSKSNPNPNSAIYLLDDDSVILKKVKKAKTDGGPTEPNQPKPDEIVNIFDLMRLVSSEDTIQYFEDAYNNCTIRYGDMKKQLGEDMVKFVTPIRERTCELQADEDYLKKVMQMGAEKARESARATLTEAKQLMGMNYY